MINFCQKGSKMSIPCTLHEDLGNQAAMSNWNKLVQIDLTGENSCNKTSIVSVSNGLGNLKFSFVIVLYSQGRMDG